MLIETEIKEMRDLLKMVKNKEVSLSEVGAQVAVYNQIAKRERLLYDIWKQSAAKKAILNQAVNKGLLANGAIEIESKPGLVLVCPEKGGKQIEMDQCLDYSGDQRNIDACQNCDNFTIARKRLNDQ